MTQAVPFSERLFFRLVSHSRLVLALGFAAIIGTGIFVPTLVQDTTADAFIDPQDPALLYRDRVEELFGLTDSVVVAIQDDSQDGIYNPNTLALIKLLTEDLQFLENIDPDRVTSLATENNITGTDDGLIVESFFDQSSAYFTAEYGSQDWANEVRGAVDQFPLLLGNLVAKDGTMAIIVAELSDESIADETYEKLYELVDRTVLPKQVTIYVAGEGAVAGYLAAYIDQDMARVNSFSALAITLVLALAFLSIRGALIPNMIVLGTAAGTFGLMGFFGVKFYVITNGLLGNLIGISVADSVYVISQYYDEQRRDETLSKRQLAARAMSKMWRPITLTTITTAAGFLALYASSVMPPAKYFGLFGAIGVVMAWFYSMTILPASLSLWPSKRLAFPFRRRELNAQENPTNIASFIMALVGRSVLSIPRTMLLIAAITASIAAYFASQVEINGASIETFRPSEPIFKADKAINKAMDGTYFLDIVVETDNPEDLYKADFLKRMEALQEFLETLPDVNGSVSIVDYVKQLHKSVNEDRDEAYVIPDNDLLISQLFFLYNASSDPTDFEEEVDPFFQRALVRANVSRSEYVNNRVIVPAVQTYIEDVFNAPGIQATATGRVTVDFNWYDGIGRSTYLGVSLALLAVTSVAMIVFRSFVGGLIAATPVVFAVLCVYAYMAYTDIWLDIGTSMFAAVAIGLAIDFAIHTLDRLRELVRENGFDDQTLYQLYPTTGRALFFNFVAVTMGFGVLTTSFVPPLVSFGTLVAVAVTTAFWSSVLIIPAMIKVFKPTFLTR